MHLKGHFYFLIFFLTLPILIGCGNEISHKERQTLDPESYLKEHQTVIPSHMSDTIDLRSVSDHFKEARLILLGETHGSALNEILDTQLFQYFYFNHGVRHYLAENGYGTGVLINKYIQTGDVNLLNSIFQLFEGTFSNTREHYQRIVELRAFNASLPSYAKIKYIGIDIEQQPGLGIKAIRSFILDNLDLYPSSIRPAFASLINSKAGNYTYAVSFAYFLLKEIQLPTRVPIYEKAFHGHYKEVILILENIVLRDELFRDSDQYLSKRESQIAENFDFVNRKYPIGNFYGKWGVFHTWKYNVENQESSFLKKAISAGYLKDKQAVSIPIFYENSFYADKNNNYISTPITSMKAPDLFQSETKESITIFDLNEPSAPFTKDILLIEGSEGVTTDYFDLMIKIRGSTASHKRD